MLVELRTYTTHPGKTRHYLALYESEGLPIQKRILGRLVGYYRAEIGQLNQVVHMWAYRDLLEREQRRVELLADPGFQAYVRKMMPLLVSQESRIGTGRILHTDLAGLRSCTQFFTRRP